LRIVLVLFVMVLLCGCISLRLMSPRVDRAKPELKKSELKKPKTPVAAMTGQKALAQLLEKYKNYGGENIPPRTLSRHGIIILVNPTTRYIDAVAMYYPPKGLGYDPVFLIFVEYPSCRVIWENRKIVINEKARSALVAQAKELAEFNELTRFRRRK